MWLFYALFSAILTGFVPILATNPSRRFGAGKSALIRASFVLIGSGILVLTSGESPLLVDPAIWLIFIASGLFDAAAWFFFYRAISESSVEIAVIREKSCVPLSIILSCLLSLRFPSLLDWTAIALFTGAILYSTRASHAIPPLLSAACTTIQMQLSKIGIDRIESQENALFLRSIFSLVFLFIFANWSFRNIQSTVQHEPEANSTPLSALLAAASGVCAFLAWKFCFSALASAQAAQVQAITKMNFWVTGLYYCFKQRGLNRKFWLAYSAMTVGSLVLIA